MSEVDPYFKQRVVKYYLDHRTTLKETARRFKIHYNSVYKWHKLYRTKGMSGLLPSYKGPWNRTDRGLEAEIVLLKEQKPSLTVLQARTLLRREGIRISAKGIWGVWKRYGYAGFLKEKYSNVFSDYIHPCKENRIAIQKITEYFKDGRMKDAAELFNSLYVCTDPKLFEYIPEGFLSPKRRLEKLSLSFGKIPFSEYRKKSKRLREVFERRKLFYSAMRAGIEELIALEWMSKTEEQIKLINHLRPFVHRTRDLGLKFTLLLSEGIAWANLMQYKKAHKCLRKCKRILKYPKTKGFVADIISLYSFLGDFKTVADLVGSYLQGRKNNIGIPVPQIASFRSIAGEYKTALRLLRDAGEKREELQCLKAIVQAQCALGQGKVHSAMRYSQYAFAKAKRAELFNYLHIATLYQAGVYYALGEERKGQDLIKRYIPLLKKLKMFRKMFLRNIILGAPDRATEAFKYFPVIRLLSMLREIDLNNKIKGYKRLVQYADGRKITGYFHIFSLFFPKPATLLLHRRKRTYLPRAILRLPVFNKQVPVYNIRFLGDLVVYKNRKYLKTKPPPKDQAFVIQLALRAGAPGRRIFLKDIYDNFWPESRNPARNLSHLLVRVKKALRIPSHLLEISRSRGALINRGIHFITDYGEFEQLLVTARAFERAGEWSFAKREYLQAFRLIRGMPLKRMFDPASDNLQRAILNRLGHAAADFAKLCTGHGYQPPARKTLKRITKLIPYSVKSLMKDL